MKYTYPAVITRQEGTNFYEISFPHFGIETYEETRKGALAEAELTLALTLLPYIKTGNTLPNAYKKVKTKISQNTFIQKITVDPEYYLEQ